MMSKSLVAYFSRRGKNYTNNGIAELKEGNTEIVAKKLAGLTGSDLFEIETVQPYPDDYQQTVAVSRQELADNARPQLKSQVANMAEYDVIYVGFPNWCGTMPMALFTFLESYDFSGKKIAPFCTHGGGGTGRAEHDIKKLCPQSESLPALSINGDRAANADEEITKWLAKRGLRK